VKLYQVRKGQFVYFNNELHKVYGVKPMYKKSVHLLRLRDLSQHLAKAIEVERYKPKEGDSFVFNHQPYTLSKDRRAVEGDYILIHNPRPDALDTYTLNEIEVVEKSDAKGVITGNSHGVKHHEYMLMIPGRLQDCHPIDFKDYALGADSDEALTPPPVEQRIPQLGDIYIKRDGSDYSEVMVTAIKGQTVYLGDGTEIVKEDLMDADKWEFLYNFLEK